MGVYAVKVGLIDIDSKMPNLALMKISAYHKAQGDTVELTGPLFAGEYDQVYASKVFTWSQMPTLPENTIIGGSGYSLSITLPDEIHSMTPDYDLYPGMDYSLGFLTRGCIRKCRRCSVREKEGLIRPENDIEDFLKHKKVLLLDNNVLACPWGIGQIEKLISLPVRVDFNQGLDARLIDDYIAGLLANVKWIRCIRVACDSIRMLREVKRAVKLLRKNGYGGEIMSYVLTRDIGTALSRVEKLRDMGVDPFVMPYRDRSGKRPDQELRRFARWVNHKAIFKTVAWEDYKG